jgi:hypothetical protein
MDDTFYCCPRVEKLHVREDDLFDIMERAEAVETKEVNFLSFNCKNIKTIGPFLHHHHNKIDILLIRLN